MAYAVGLLVLVVGLMVSIALHEVGHMVPAKRFGVRVSQYMVGFGPTLWSRTRGETEYGVKAIPLGGYVRLVGMFPPAHVVGAPRRTGRLAELVDAAREASAEEIRPGEDHRAFYRLSTPKKLVVMLGGPVMNLVLAVALVALTFLGTGLPGATTTVATVGECVLPADAGPDTACGPDDAPAPASLAGLREGDRLVSYDGVPTERWADFQAAVRSAGAQDVTLVVERDGREVALEVSPVAAERPVFDETGRPVLDDDGDPVLATTPYVGLSPTVGMVRLPAGDVLPFTWDVVRQTVGVVATLPARMVELVQATFGGAERDASGVVGLVGVGRFAGEIAADGSADLGVTYQVARFLLLLASLNVALFAFNLIPLPPLDGGHVAGALWEGARRQVARLRGRPRPAPADVARLMPLTYGVFIALVGMGLLLVYADIVRPVTL
ncbi:site-2 protease family protein [Actinotalea sp. AC32]|nr:site-2 protease family protein [Actinotalea sp. AC32]